MKEFEIYCPKCAWRPAPQDRWECGPGCGAVWNTFWTRGLCPGCGKQWQVTQCLACQQLSAHQHWYHLPERRPGEAHKRDEPLTQG